MACAYDPTRCSARQIAAHSPASILEALRGVVTRFSPVPPRPIKLGSAGKRMCVAVSDAAWAYRQREDAVDVEPADACDAQREVDGAALFARFLSSETRMGEVSCAATAATAARDGLTLWLSCGAVLRVERSGEDVVAWLDAP